MPGRLCKQTNHVQALRGTPVRGRSLLILVGLTSVLVGFPACTWQTVRRTVTLSALEAAPQVYPTNHCRRIAIDPSALQPVARPLSERIALVQVHSPMEWDQLCQATGAVASCPDFSRGMIVGLISQTGTPLDGSWPFEWGSVHVHEGAGLLRVHFTGGSYFPDGTTYVETAYVENLGALLVVDINGDRFYPNQ
ncbi:MAG: hypothetical protein ABIG44_06710 [Planctomycetota bacterium]